ncbi:TRAP transporter small permease [Cereibacter sphaeroides]|jgi:TRAP-type C4-dicarboxylate transport system permease small subunit|uniref:TRAP transporter small permease n=1 Tax=Cereibacter sphaeroides TaxID=1063 RepID=UPI0000665559|nr:TRAP transporter small permease [Cereibacter sphaeroides]ABN77390.1 Tripartite ATP-independent periplasmic transporter, DctQ component [Cereibacter sphaeroides ATCC 17029]AZB54590.1 TRAP transporter small permease [Cereibacter sphaeroides]AZB58846.1 TRAP transporter small permease [Cereibacter sphaeroides]
MIERLLYRMSRLLMLVASVGLILMMVQTVVDVIADNFFGKPIAGNLEIISVYHMVLVVFLPIAMVEWKHENIQVDLFYLMMPSWAQRASLALGYLICAIFFAILARQTWIDAVASWRKNELMMAAVYVLVWPAKFILPVGFGAITLVCLRHFLRSFTAPLSTFAPETTETHV